MLIGGLLFSTQWIACCMQDHVANGGEAWDTVKPLRKWFKDLSRVILVDDDAYKVSRPSLFSVHDRNIVLVAPQ